MRIKTILLIVLLFLNLLFGYCATIRLDVNNIDTPEGDWMVLANGSWNSWGWGVELFDFNDEVTVTEPPIHPFAGTWKVTDYCVYESLNISLDGNCNNQEFIPIFYQAGIPYSTNMWSYLSEGRVITIDENGDADGGINFSQSQQNFRAGSGGYSWESFPGVGAGKIRDQYNRRRKSWDNRDMYSDGCGNPARSLMGILDLRRARGF